MAQYESMAKAAAASQLSEKQSAGSIKNNAAL